MRALPRRSLQVGSAAFAVGLGLWPSSVLADVGLPMLVFVWPASWILLLPVVLVEGAVARRFLLLPLGRCLKISLVANLVSTAVGIPLAWVAALIVELLLAGIGVGLHHVGRGYIPQEIIAISAIAPAWIGPTGPTEQRWIVPAAALALCVPFFFASVYIERWVARKMVLPPLRDRIRDWSSRANLISYCAIGVVLLALTIYLLVHR